MKATTEVAEIGTFSTSAGRTETPPPATRKDRLTVVDNVYFTSRDGQSEQFTSRFDRELAGDELPYQRRRMVAGPTWQELDLGWCADGGLSMLVVYNDEGKFERQPTPEQRAEMATRVLEVGDYSHPWLVPPGESLRGLPSFKVHVRSRNGGPVQFSVVAVPA